MYSKFEKPEFKNDPHPGEVAYL